MKALKFHEGTSKILKLNSKETNKKRTELTQSEGGSQIFRILGKTVAAATIGDYLVNPRFLD